MFAVIGKRLLFCLVAIHVCGLCSVNVIAAESSVEADKLWDFANGLFIRGETFYPEAERQYKAFLAGFPEDERAERAMYRLGECYRLQGKYEEAYDTYIGHKKYAENEIRDKVDFRTGQVLYQMGRFGDAIAHLEPLYNKALEDDLKEITSFYYGRALMGEGKVEEGRKVLMPLASDKDGRFSVYANYHIATAEMRSEDYKQAIEHFKPVAESRSSLAAEAQFRLGELHLKINELDKGSSFYAELITRFPDSEYVPYAAYGTVWARFAEGRHDECVAAYEKYGKLISDEVKPEILYLVGNCHYETERYEEAIDYYLSVPRDFPDSPYVWRARYKTSWSLFMLKKYEQAISYAQSYLERFPDAEDADKLRFLAGESHLGLKNLDKARAEFAEVVGKFPESVFYRDSLFKLGWCRFQQKDYVQAREDFRLFAGEFPEHSRAAEALVRAAESSIRLIEEEKGSRKELGEEAARDYEAFLEKYPGHQSREEVLFQLAILYVDIEHGDSAIATFKRLVEEFPDGKHSSDAYYWIAREYQKKKKYGEEITQLEKAINASETGKFRERAQYQLASIHHEQGEFEKAAAVLIPLLEKNPEFDIPQNTYIWVSDYLREKEKYKEAIGLYDKFLKKHSESRLAETAYFGLGECYYALGRWPEAIDNYSEAVAMRGPTLLESKISLGVSYARDGKFERARPILVDISKSGVPEHEARALFWLGNMLFDEAKQEKDREARKKKLDRARLDFIKVEILYNSSDLRPESMFRVAEAFELSGDIEEAMKQYQKVVDEYPDSDLAEQSSNKIKLNQSE